MDERRPSYEELAVLVVELGEAVEELRAENRELRSRLGELERQLGQDSGNSGKPPSRDSAAERQRQAEEKKRAEASGGATRRRGKQRGVPGTTLPMTKAPDEIVDHRPERSLAVDRHSATTPVTRATSDVRSSTCRQ